MSAACLMHRNLVAASETQLDNIPQVFLDAPSGEIQNSYISHTLRLEMPAAKRVLF